MSLREQDSLSLVGLLRNLRLHGLESWRIAVRRLIESNNERGVELGKIETELDCFDFPTDITTPSEKIAYIRQQMEEAETEDEQSCVPEGLALVNIIWEHQYLDI